MGKNCDRGLENAARGRRTRAAFSSPRSQFFPIYGPTLSRTITFLSFLLAVKLAFKWVCLRNSVTELAFRAVYKPFAEKQNKTTTRERESIYETKKDVLKNRFISNYLMLVAFTSPVKFSKRVFSGVKFRAKFGVVLQKQFLSVAENHSKMSGR